MENIYITIGIFFTLQVINVTLSTAKTLIMTRTNNPHLSAIINAITFGFYTAVVKQIAGLDLIVTITVTMVTNVIGVYLTYWIAGKLQKDNLWKIEIYNKDADGISTQLELRGIPHLQFNAEIITAYCYTQADSVAVKEIISNHPDSKYNITEITKRF